MITDMFESLQSEKVSRAIRLNNVLDAAVAAKEADNEEAFTKAITILAKFLPGLLEKAEAQQIPSEITFLKRAITRLRLIMQDKSNDVTPIRDALNLIISRDAEYRARAA